MKINTQNTENIKICAGYESSKFALVVGVVLSGLVGLWGCACMISGFINGDLLRGLLTAITGY